MRFEEIEQDLVEQGKKLHLHGEALGQWRKDMAALNQEVIDGKLTDPKEAEKRLDAMEERLVQLTKRD